MSRYLFFSLFLVAFLAGCSSANQEPVTESASGLESIQVQTNATPQPANPVDLVPGTQVAGIGTIESFVFTPWASGVAASGFGSVWLSHWEGPFRYVSRIDLASGEVIARTQIQPIHSQPGNVWENLFTTAATGEGVWVNRREARTLGLIDPDSNEIVREIPTGVKGFVLAADGETVWLTNPYTNSLLRVNTLTDQIEATIEVPYANTMALGADAVWVVENFHRNSANKVARIDTSTNDLIAEIEVPDPGDIVFAEGGVWVTSSTDMAVVRIDPATNEVAARIELAGASEDIWGLAYGGGSIWVRVGPEGHPDCDGNFIARIDPATNQEEARLYLPCVVGEVFFAGDHLWAQLDPSPALREEMNLGSGVAPIVRIRPEI